MSFVVFCGCCLLLGKISSDPKGGSLFIPLVTASHFASMHCLVENPSKAGCLADFGTAPI